ncbi:MAG TPA: mechanosensitive ion channel domain-containing protein [Thermoanaerobaculia bacterium]|nr:mechanosensitive ion channel domain-containing protein [Thermoanaerobaculia bacterium]
MTKGHSRWVLGTGVLLLAAGVGFGLWRENRLQGIGRLRIDPRNLWSQPLFDLGSLPVSPAFLLKAAVFLILLNLLARGSGRVLQKRILARTAIDEGQKYAIARGVGYAVFLGGLFIGLQAAGIDLSSFAIVGGAIGFGIGFGLQSLAKDFVSGLILLIERGVKVGDRIEVSNLLGDVKQIGARTTWVQTNDNVVILVPNSELTARVTNWTAHGRLARFSLEIGVAYTSDPEKVRDTLTEVARANEGVLNDPAPDVIFTGFGDSALNFQLRVWTSRHLRTPQTLKSELYFAIFRRFREDWIEIPFPQHEVRVIQPDGAASVLSFASGAPPPEAGQPPSSPQSSESP